MSKMKNINNKSGYFVDARPNKKLYRFHDTLLVYGQLYGSILASIAIMMGCAYWNQGQVAEKYQPLAVVNGLLVYIIYQLMGVYHQSDGNLLGRRRSFLFGLWVLSKAWALVVLSLVFFTFITKSSAEYSRLVLVLWATIGLLVQSGVYFLTYLISKKYLFHFREPIPTLVVGANALGEQLVNKLSNNTWLPDKIVGIIDDDPEARSSWDGPVPVLGTIDDLKDILKQHNIRRIYLTLLLSQSSKVEDIIKELDEQCVDIIWIPDTFTITTINQSIKELSGLPLLVLSGSPMSSVKAMLMKSLMDKVIALTSLIILLPLMVPIALAIKLTSPGPVFFKQKRHGWDGKEIDIWKFRSMYVMENKENKLELAKRNDPRVTAVGKFIRKTSIDELPQLFNVIQGNMSLVGPRPHAIEVNQFYSKHIPSFMLRHRIKPGITGLAQICGFRGGDDCTTKTLDRMELRAAHDIEYINHWSLLLDLKILLITPFKLLSHDAY
ncbi:undecaprenyl-phosphate glucose phosphotransferase [Photobacterium lipolyticum]|uniref:Undecaprenyl-phosphate glucose phosphotransferase n=1 Tax=Photobacterium lipolyticum TaxID=266810 RepID=A0A2T3MV55_9GAMM|nr:undecaprenyl-phosphate glucose phosphotransferase [Photobacterium lipolyticum]PSW03722.1 undecaprenyl-phosphate glucose phosphotransferase [Photobacterium lipolyticum]